MEIISLTTIDEVLNTLGADEATKLLIINNVSFYNDLVVSYQDGNLRNLYLTYQLNVQINKQLNELRKLNMKVKSSDEDGFTELIKSLKS